MRTEGELAVDRHELLFRVTKSMLYHSQRAFLLKIVNQIIGITTILVNIGSVGTLLARGGRDLPLIAAAFTILGSLIGRLCRIPETIVKDEEKAQRLRDLLEEMKMTHMYGEKELLEFWDRARKVEPPPHTLKILHHFCHNRTIVVMKLDQQYRHKWWWRRLAVAIAHLLRKRKSREAY